MKKQITLIVLMLFSLNSFAQFDKYFEKKTLRVDYSHCGTATTEDFFINELIQEPNWGGNPNYMIDKKEYGSQLFKVYDVESGELIYSQGFGTLFDEWQTSAEAKVAQRCYPESIVMPYPKNPVRIEISSRDRQNKWNKKFTYTVDPKSYTIRKANPTDEVFYIVNNGSPEKKVDIVLLAEGYTAGERKKFEADCKKFVSEMFVYEPYKGRAKNFNVCAVWRPSKDSGASLPGKGIWKETALRSNYYTFGMDRYVMIDNFQLVRNMAANAPYDFIYVIANSTIYGGGGIYNFYAISAANGPRAGKVYAHEFGHLFGGLADEYVGADGYEDFYPAGVEPWEENLTTLTNFKSKMWHDMLPKGTPIPTPVSRDGGLGVYEGGGYVSKGVYRPWPNCMMNAMGDFCPVCTKVLNDRVDLYTK